MNKIRVITQFFDTYKTPEDVDNLLKKVSFQLIHKFTQKIQENDKNIMTEYNDKLYKMLEKNEELKKKWRKENKH